MTRTEDQPNLGRPPHDSADYADYSTQHGAMIIASRIRAYWAERGFRVDPVVVQNQHTNRHPSFSVVLPPFTAQGWPATKLVGKQSRPP